ncbi:MAG: hypothetical protein AVDCRST_MAG30-916, partial [uncultured Solirubrobacteraceae bacterium]
APRRPTRPAARHPDEPPPRPRRGAPRRAVRRDGRRRERPGAHAARLCDPGRPGGRGPLHPPGDQPGRAARGLRVHRAGPRARRSQRPGPRRLRPRPRLRRAAAGLRGAGRCGRRRPVGLPRAVERPRPRRLHLGRREPRPRRPQRAHGRLRAHRERPGHPRQRGPGGRGGRRPVDAARPLGQRRDARLHVRGGEPRADGPQPRERRLRGRPRHAAGPARVRAEGGRGQRGVVQPRGLARRALGVVLLAGVEPGAGRPQQPPRRLPGRPAHGPDRAGVGLLAPPLAEPRGPRAVHAGLRRLGGRPLRRLRLRRHEPRPARPQPRHGRLRPRPPQALDAPRLGDEHRARGDQRLLQPDPHAVRPARRLRVLRGGPRPGRRDARGRLRARPAPGAHRGGRRHLPRWPAAGARARAPAPAAARPLRRRDRRRLHVDRRRPRAGRRQRRRGRLRPRHDPAARRLPARAQGGGALPPAPRVVRRRRPGRPLLPLLGRRRTAHLRPAHAPARAAARAPRAAGDGRRARHAARARGQHAALPRRAV